MSHVGRVMDASHGMYAPMTPAQGKFLTSLLDQATAKHAPAGDAFRMATRTMYAEGTLTKQAASKWIDGIKKFLDARHPEEAAQTVLRTAAAPSRRPVATSHPRPTRTLATTPAQPTSDREAAMVARLAQQGPTPLTDSVRQAVASVKAKAAATPSQGRGMDLRGALRNWTPGQAATRAEVGF